MSGNCRGLFYTSLTTKSIFFVIFVQAR